MTNLKDLALYSLYKLLRAYWQLVVKISFLSRHMEIRAALQDALLAAQMNKLKTSNYEKDVY